MSNIYYQLAFAATFATLFSVLIWGINEYNKKTIPTKSENQRAQRVQRSLFGGGDSGFIIIAIVFTLLFFGLFFV